MPTFDTLAAQRINNLHRTRLAPSVFTVREPNKKVAIWFKGTTYQARAIMAIAANIIDRIVTETDYSTPKSIVKISYRRSMGNPQHYIGIFTLDFSRLNLESYLSMIREPALREEVRKSFSRILVKIKTTPFKMPDEHIELVNDIGLINLISEAQNAEAALARLREPERQIMDHLADQLETKLAKTTFLKTQFIKSAETLIKRLLGIK